ncbi:DUF3017 domain-containing protein [Actinomyces vulturis]|uniref:DUF3017 domain-containing protein n=1 Tax=Actinomyces vulturis TaxID=1857645 RepID=UPI001FE0C4FC|nr:DUF3017 domain-containing protein [Actinomyces vulturis]
MSPISPMKVISPDTGDRRREPYRTMAVVGVSVGIVLIVVCALLGYQRVAVLFTALATILLAMIRLLRPDGTWIAARSRRFDVLFGLGLGAALLLLLPYANLPRVI